MEAPERFAERAPAAFLFHMLFSRVVSGDALDQIFSDHRERQVEGELLFSSLLHVLTAAVSGAKKSVHAAYQDSELDVSCQSFYNKLKGVEVEVSRALVHVPAAQICKIREKLGLRNEDVISGYHTFVIDGKKFNGTQHRLKETRRSNSAPLPGMAIALFDTRTETFVDVECEKDAYRCERKVIEPMMERLKPGALYLADRNFCDGPLIDQFLHARAWFLVRHHGRSPSWREIEGEKPEFKGKDDRGGKVYEQAIEIKLPDGSWYRVRRTTIKLNAKTRDGDKELHLLTNLPKSVKAVLIANAYAKRWTIESCFGYLSQSLNAEINTLCYPGAAALSFCLALTLFNLMSALRALLLAHGQTDDDSIDVSYYYLANEISECQAGLAIMIDEDHWHQYGSMPQVQFLKALKQVARYAKLKRYRKHPRGPKRPPPKRASGKQRAHVSTQRILMTRK